ncbi:hypothetical protein [Olleya sp. UBA1516]|uniref:hypothetical protein n=1 Tax=Olleya sp. UBA1516 TaxID=1947013 RepID=UPI0025DE3890|nr:hypothetical protein [Olleya sp. UBA1516]
MKRNKRRHNTGFGYIGSGNQASVFNQHPKALFSNIKKQLNTASHKQFETDFTATLLSEAEKRQIKNKIRKQAKQKNIIVVFLTTFFLILIVVLAIAMLKGLLS